MNRSRIKQLFAVNIVTIVLFLLAILTYIIYGAGPFIGLCVLDLIYALASNGYVLLANDLTSGQEALWRRRFNEEISMLETARLSIEARRGYLETASSPVIRNAYLETARRINSAEESARSFLYSYDFVNSPDDHGRMMSYAREANRAITDLNELIDDAFDADGGAGDELDDNIRQIHRLQDRLPDDLKAKLDDTLVQLEKVSTLLHERPEAADKFRKLFSYYLPTLSHLLEKYGEFASDDLQGENIDAAKKDISDVISEMPDAIKKMMDSYYQMDALNVRSEKKVMNTLMEQDGLK